MNTTVDTAQRVQSVRTAQEQKILTLLGSGCNPEIVATAVGLSVSRISQLLSEPEFSAEVAELRFNNLQKHNELDNTYDSLEAKLIDQLKDVLPLIMRPMELLKAIQVINNAKRKGQSAPDSMTIQNTVVNLLMPTQITQKFTTNINNQVINAGNQTLETMQAGTLLNAAKQKAGELHEQARLSSSGGNRITEVATIESTTR